MLVGLILATKAPRHLLQTATIKKNQKNLSELQTGTQSIGVHKKLPSLAGKHGPHNLFENQEP